MSSLLGAAQVLEREVGSFCHRKMLEEDDLGLKLTFMLGKGRMESYFPVVAMGPLYPEMSKVFQSSASFQKDGYNLP